MSSADALETLPVFPLPSVQLFPHALLPLHVFEPRYRDLVRDCMAGDHRMAIALLEPGYEARYHERPAIRSVCGVGRVVGHDLLPDGRSNIILRGLGRARIVEELPAERSYRRIRVARLADRLARDLDRAAAQRTLLLLADRLALRLPSGSETLRRLTRSQDELGGLTDVLAAALVTEPDTRQELLETVDVAARVDRVTGYLAEMLSRFSDPSSDAN
jgi:Lon protease-like protein